MEESTINYSVVPSMAVLTVLAHLANTVHHMVSFFLILVILKTLLKTYFSFHIHLDFRTSAYIVLFLYSLLCIYLRVRFIFPRVASFYRGIYPVNKRETILIIIITRILIKEEFWADPSRRRFRYRESTTINDYLSKEFDNLNDLREKKTQVVLDKVFEDKAALESSRIDFKVRVFPYQSCQLMKKDRMEILWTFALIGIAILETTGG